MTDEKKEPFVVRGNDWYVKALDYKEIIYETNHDTHVAKITLNRPKKMNAMTRRLQGELFHALKVAERNNEINVIIIKGAGPSFCAGYDLQLGGRDAEEPDCGSQYVGVTHRWEYLLNQYWQIWQLSKVVIAQTHGHVLAGGMHLCCLCDLLVTTPDCQFGEPMLRSAAGPDLMYQPWFLPMRKAAEMIYTGDSISGEEAYRLGMANYCVPEEDIDEFTDAFARRVALIPWQNHSLRKKSFHKAYELMGIRTAMEITAQMAEIIHQSEYDRKWAELREKMPLKEWLAMRDGPYKEAKAVEQEILNRRKREWEV
ncbi:enoyl-CoA hydratase-related protein [Chloroflexota bacterium]